jgi:TolB protein
MRHTKRPPRIFAEKAPIVADTAGGLCSRVSALRPQKHRSIRALSALFPRKSAAAVLLFPWALIAQRRDPPFAQVAVPHAYYWREMYLPQVTSGPSAATWSPDGKELIYSMQGSLWRQRVGTATAVQLTGGNTYDFQPDWSPDGKRVAYSAYNGRALTLMLLDLATGNSTPITDDSTVNVEPRWSPDGTRIAFVSTAFNARWHVFVAYLTQTHVDSVVRLTEDHDSGLPRYYYSRFDHYLSPTWSPDGRELIVVSNRGHIYGTGGLWRMEARPGAAMQEIHSEETSWKARPDWARDGKRVVFSSYAGRQWNQLWVTPSVAGAGDALPLTFGDFDATAPRWSPDASRIAYVSNEGGNTSLWVVTVPGGARQQVNATSRRYLQPMARLIVAVADSETRRPLASRVSVSSSVSGKFFAPDNAWRHADEAIVRDEQRFEYGYWHSRGTDTLMVTPGQVIVEVWRGPQWHTVSRIVNARSGVTTTVAIKAWPLANLRQSGWWSGDVHVHMNYGGAYHNTPEHLALQASAEGLNVVENLVVNKEQRFPDVPTWSATPLFTSANLIIANGQEFHTSVPWGHASALGLRDHYILPDFAGYAGTAFASPVPMNAQLFDLAHAQGAITGYVHPFDVPLPTDMTEVQRGVPYELPVDVALGKVDFLEVMGYSDPLITSDVWYKLLNCGFKLPAAAGTDAFPNFALLRGPPGLVRTFAKAGDVLNHRAWLDAIKAGRTFVTNAPLLTLSVEGHGIGDELRLTPGRHRLSVHVAMRSPVPVDRLELVSNGKVVMQLPFEAREPGAVRMDTTVTIPVSGNTWFVARAYSDKPRLPVLDLYPFASTSPVYVRVGRGTTHCSADADYFLAWIDALAARVSADTTWNTSAERDVAVQLMARARAVLASRR